MAMTIRGKLTTVVACASLIGCLATLLFFAGKELKLDIDRSRSAAFDSGFRAAQAGVPATANPRTGAFSQEWLDGWIEGSQRYGDGSSAVPDSE